MKLLTVYVLFLFIQGCSDKPVNPEKVSFGEEFTLSPLETIMIDKDFTVTYVGYVDGRCPEEVQCVREGELFANLMFKQKTTETGVRFCVSGECLPRKTPPLRDVYYSGDEVSVGSDKYQIEIVDFFPKIPTQKNQSASYSLTLKVIKSI